MEAFASIVLLTDVASYRLEPVRRVGLKQGRVVNHYLQDEDLHIDVGLGTTGLLVQSLHKEGHGGRVLLPGLRLKELDHLVDASLDVSHALVLVHVVHLELVLSLGVFRGQEVLFLLFLLHLIVIPLDKSLKFVLFRSSIGGLVLRRRLGFEDHGRVELFVGTHEGGVDILINEVMCAEFGYVDLPVNLLLNGLELHVGEVGFHLEVEGGVLVYDEGPDAVLLTTLSIGNKEKLRE